LIPAPNQDAAMDNDIDMESTTGPTASGTSCSDSAIDSPDAWEKKTLGGTPSVEHGYGKWSVYTG